MFVQMLKELEKNELKGKYNVCHKYIVEAQVLKDSWPL